MTFYKLIINAVLALYTGPHLPSGYPNIPTDETLCKSIRICRSRCPFYDPMVRGLYRRSSIHKHGHQQGRSK